MRAAGQLLYRLAGSLGLLAALVLALFGLLQTEIGHAWLARVTAQAASGPGFSVAIRGLGGVVPFRMTAGRIDLADAGGRWLSLKNVGLDLSAASLLTGRVEVRSLSAAAIDVVRLPSGPLSGRSEPLAERVRLPHLPIALRFDRISVARLSLAPVIFGTGVVAAAAGSAELAGGTARLALDLGRIDGSPGQLALTMAIAGAPPVLNLRLAASEPTGILLDRLLGRTDRLPLALALSGAGPLADWHGRLTASAGALARFDAAVTIAAAARTELGLTATAAVAPLLPAEFASVVGDRVAVSLQARLGGRIVLDRLALETAAGKVTGDAAFGGADDAVVAHLRAEVPKLSALAGLLGTTLDGAAVMTAAVSGNASHPSFAATLFGTGIRVSRSQAERVEADVAATPTGAFDDPKTRFALTARGRIDGLARMEGFTLPPGLAPSIDWSLAANASGGAFDLDRLAVAGIGASLSGNGRFDTVSHRLAAALTLAVPRLASLGAALGMPIAGDASVHVSLDGPLDRLRLAGTIDGSGIAAAGAKIGRLHLDAQVPDLSAPKAVVDGTFRAFGLDGKLALAAARDGNSELAVPSLRLTAADSMVAGNLRIALDSGLVSGVLSGRVPDLARWSEAAGMPLAGGLDLTAGLDARAGQGIDLKAAGARLSAGTGSARVAIGSLALTARLADIWRRPMATARVSLGSASLGAARFTTASANLDMPRPGRFAFAGDANGQLLTIAFAGDGGSEPGAAQLSLTRLAGSFGKERIRLEQPLSLSRRGADLVLSGLALDLGPGRITGSGARRGEALSLTVEAAGLPIAPGADLLGYHRAHGSLSFAATIGGSLRSPRGHVALSARDLAVAVAEHSHATRLGLDVEGDWNGRAVDLTGRVTGLHGDRMGFSGSLPLLLTTAPFGISVPRDGPLALRVEGGGELGHLADLLPLGEDRLSGRFAADVSVGGTIAAPAASGKLTMSDARYANFASGAVLTDIDAALVGDRDRFTVASFSAADGAAGHLTGQGGIVLDGASGPTADLSARTHRLSRRRARRGGGDGNRHGHRHRPAECAESHCPADRRSCRYHPAAKPAALDRRA